MLCSILVSQLIRRLPKQLLHLLARIIPISVIVTASAGVHPVILHQLLALQIILVPGKSCIRPAEKLIQAGQPACGKLFEIAVASSCLRFLSPAFLPLCKRCPHIMIKIFPENIFYFISAQLPVVIVLHDLISFSEHLIPEKRYLRTALRFQHIPYFLVVVRIRRYLIRIHGNFHTILPVIYLLLPFAVLVRVCSKENIPLLLFCSPGTSDVY